MLGFSLAGGSVEIPHGWTGRGLRVLLLAASPTPAMLHDAEGATTLPPDLAPRAWLGLADELRPNIAKTLAGFREVGIALKIISGDNPETVAALARQAGVVGEARLITGPELTELDDARFVQLAEEGTIFGRITAEQKERLVDALRRRGHYVAMIGDGVNDILSLKRSNLAVAMGAGTQATKGVADLILLDDSFGSLASAVEEGNRIRNGMQDILRLSLTGRSTCSAASSSQDS